jgi:TonB family protein
VTATFPLAAAPQSDAAGVTINLGGGAVLHRTPVDYPEAARAKGVQGDVTLEVKLDSTGTVADARVLSGPEELRKPALESVLQWHFTRESAGMTRQVTVGFHPSPSVAGVATAGAASVPPQAEQQAAIVGRTVKNIIFNGLPEDQQNDLKGKLPIHQGDTVTADLLAQTTAAVKDYDEHLSVLTPSMNDGTATIIILRPNSDASTRIRIGGNMQQNKLVAQARPTYPPEAKAARVSGVVRLSAVIAKDGTVKELDVISGDPLLVPSAMQAVKQWVYQPTLLNGNPVEVVTQIDVNYTLSK